MSRKKRRTSHRENRRSTDRRKRLIKEGRLIDPREVNVEPLQDRQSKSNIDRRRKYTIGAVAAAIGIIAAGEGVFSSGSNNKNETNQTGDTLSASASSAPPNPETAKQTEITLGNYTLFLEDPDQISAQQSAEIFSKLKRAYQKIVEVFGPEIVASGEARTRIPLEINSELKGAQARVKWDQMMTLSEATNYEPVATRLDGISMVIKPGVNDSTTFHELVHLCVQGSELHVSNTFLEGHANMLEEALYPLDEEEIELNEILQVPAVSDTFNIGLDYSFLDESRGAGITSSSLRKLACAKYKKFWKKVQQKDPEFLKKFYEEISKQKKQGKKSFSRAELVGIAKSVSEAFVQLNQEEGIILKPLGEDNPTAVLKAFIIPSQNAILILNFQMIGQKQNGPEGEVTLRRTDLAEPGQEYTITIYGKTVQHPNGQVSIIDISDRAVPRTPGSLQISINGKNIPIEY